VLVHLSIKFTLLWWHIHLFSKIIHFIKIPGALSLSKRAPKKSKRDYVPPQNQLSTGHLWLEIDQMEKVLATIKLHWDNMKVTINGVMDNLLKENSANSDNVDPSAALHVLEQLIFENPVAEKNTEIVYKKKN